MNILYLSLLIVSQSANPSGPSLKELLHQPDLRALPPVSFSVKRTVRLNQSGSASQPGAIDRNLSSSLSVSGPKFRELLLVEQYRHGKLHLRDQFITASNGVTRQSMKDEIAANGASHVVLSRSAECLMAEALIDPMVLTSDAVQMYRAVSEDSIRRRLKDSWVKKLSEDSATRKFQLVPASGDTEIDVTWDIARGLPVQVEIRNASKKLVSRTVASKISQAYAPLPKHFISQARYEQFGVNGKATVIEAEITNLRIISPAPPPELFEIPLEKGAVVRDRTKSPYRKRRDN